MRFGFGALQFCWTNKTQLFVKPRQVIAFYAQTMTVIEVIIGNPTSNFARLEIIVLRVQLRF